MDKYLNKIKSIVDNNGFERHYKETEIVESVDDTLERVLFEARRANNINPASKNH